MVLLLAPVAYAGYVYYKKQQEEREAMEGRTESDQSDHSDAINQEADDSSTSDDATQPGLSPQTSFEEGSTKPDILANAMNKFFRFCENLEKDMASAQERRLQAFVDEAFERKQSRSSLQMNKSSEVNVFDNKNEASISVFSQSQ
eukprot:Nitzschia sp. Nitz4//scaffold77_size91520//57709//58143//NITZ4_004896-RA/size91520-processed-gene-0.36-mRNA-1//1//CDS//3329558009//8443//frame0